MKSNHILLKYFCIPKTQTLNFQIFRKKIVCTFSSFLENTDILMDYFVSYITDHLHKRYTCIVSIKKMKIYL